MSTEKKPNHLKEMVLNGEITAYGIKELNRAQQLFNEIMRNDLEAGRVDKLTLQLCRDPESVYRDLLHSNDPFTAEERALD